MKKDIYETTVEEFNNFDTRKAFFSIVFLIFLITVIWFLDLLRSNISANDLGVNILGGIILIIVVNYVIPFVGDLYKKAAFRGIFGNNITGDFFVFYGSLNLRLDLLIKEGGIYEPIFKIVGNLVKINRPPFTKYRNPSNLFTVTPELASSGELRGTNYFLKSFEENIKHAPIISSDEKNEERCDVSFISIGGKNNLRTDKVLTENDFYKFSDDGAIIQKQNQDRRFCIQDENGRHKYDHGFIIKIIPKNYPNQVWIAVAGIGEWGTSGAAWFLAKRWREFPANKPFGAIIRVEIGKDESGELVELLSE